jgi:crotonobetainyl-CoA:carnitine CoA-transferase CaiB-like acyl-CoA transferase
VELEQLRSRRLLQPVETGHGQFRFAASGFELAHGSSEIRRAAPRLGQHSAEVLREAGLDDAAIEALAADGVTLLG